MTDDEREALRAIVLEELYEVFVEARGDMEYERRRKPLGAGARTARVVEMVIDRRLRELHPEAYERMAERIVAERGTEFDDEDEEDETSGEERGAVVEARQDQQSGPLTTEILDREFDENAEAWWLIDTDSGGHLAIPNLTLGKEIVNIFLRREDADEYARKVCSMVESMKGRNISPVRVKLKAAIRQINAVGFPVGVAVHPPNEMYEYFRDFGGAE